MGTSTARRGPSGRFWRAARAAGTRYLAPEEGGLVTAREVAARYVAALEESAGPEESGLLGAFRLTRKVAQDLGAFWAGAAAPQQMRPLDLAAALAGPEAGLEAEVARASLAAVLIKLPSGLNGSPSPIIRSEPAPALVSRFLASCLYHRLAFDLGESLEAAAPGWGRLRERMEELRVLITGPEGQGLPRGPDSINWQGLPGWIWVTEELTSLIRRLKGPDGA